MGKRSRSGQAKDAVPGPPAQTNTQALQGAPAAALQELAMLQSQAAMLSAQLQEVSARALATMQACSQLAATVAGQTQTAAHAASVAAPTDAASTPRQNPALPNVMAGFPNIAQFPFVQQSQAQGTPAAWPASIAPLPSATTSEIEEALQSTSRRREKDKEKKRKRRDMSGSLLKQLQNMMPGENLSLNATLQRTIEAVKAQISKGSESVAAIEPGNVPPSILRSGMRMYRRVGMAVVNSDMRVIDANLTMAQALNPHAEDGAESSVRGQPICKFIHHRDEMQLRLAASHVAQAKLKDEALRRYVVGIRVRSPSDPTSWDCRAVEVVACGSNSYGHLFMLFLFQVDPQRSAAKVMQALTSFGDSFAAASDDFVSFEFADEVDSKGMHQVLREDPTHFDILMEMASADRQTLDGFVHELRQFDADSTKVFKVFAQFLARMVEAEKIKADRRQDGLEVASMKLNPCIQALQSMCSAGRFNVVKSPDTVKLQWSVAGLSVAETVATKANEFEVVCVNGSRKGPVPVRRNNLQVTLLDTGDVWFHHTEVPTGDEKRGGMSRYLNVVLSRMPCGGLHLRRYPMLDGQTFSQSRIFRPALAEQPVFADYKMTKQVMKMFFEWCQRSNRPISPPRISNEDEQEEELGLVRYALPDAGFPSIPGSPASFRFSPSPVPRLLFSVEVEEKESDTTSLTFSPYPLSSPSSPSPFGQSPGE